MNIIHIIGISIMTLSVLVGYALYLWEKNHPTLDTICVIGFLLIIPFTIVGCLYDSHIEDKKHCDTAFRERQLNPSDYKCSYDSESNTVTLEPIRLKVIIKE